MRRSTLTILLLVTSTLAAANDAAVPMPVPRPRIGTPAEPPEAIPMPVPRPAGGIARPEPEKDAEPDGDCLALARSGHADFASAAPIRNGACGAPHPMMLSAIRLEGGGTVTLEPAATMTCAMALAVVAWTRNEVDPAARALLGGPVDGLRNAASYDCRGRNRVAGARLSEHGRANALDVRAFRRTGGGWIEVEKPGEAAAFLNRVREKACGPFTTVLGPGSDRYHNDHLHLDLARRGRSGRGLWCK